MFKAQAFHDFMGKNFVSKRLRHFSIADVSYGRSEKFSIADVPYGRSEKKI